MQQEGSREENFEKMKTLENGTVHEEELTHGAMNPWNFRRTFRLGTPKFPFAWYCHQATVKILIHQHNPNYENTHTWARGQIPLMGNARPL